MTYDLSTPARMDIEADASLPFAMTLSLKNPDGTVFPLAGKASAMQVRTSPESTSVALAPSIAADTVAGTLALSATAANMALPPGMYAYDLLIDNRKVLEGFFRINPTVTRP